MTPVLQRHAKICQVCRSEALWDELENFTFEVTLVVQRKLVITNIPGDECQACLCHKD